GDAVAGAVSQLGTTLPAAIAILAASIVNLAAGAVLVRLVRASPYTSIAELLLSGLVGAVLLDTFLLFLLGSFGLFGQVLLVLVHVLILAAGWFVRPWLDTGDRRGPRLGLLPWTLVALVWAAPVIAQLASPVVPYVDVLPNHVAPVQHVIAFGNWDSLGVA